MNHLVENWKKEDVAIVFIDYQPEVLGAITSKSHQLIKLNVALLAKTAVAWGIPTVLSSVGVQMGVNGPTIEPLRSILKDNEEIDRSSMNAWQDENFLKALKATGKNKIAFAAIWSEICLTYPVLDALKEGYEVQFITDATGGITKETHDTAVARLIQAGAVPNASLAFLTELSPDWANADKEIFRPLVMEYFEGLSVISQP